jgi:4-hydroxythreonine-4-phosphate dehydrogenase
VLGDHDTFSARIQALGLGLQTERIDRLTETPVHRAGRLALLHIPLAEPARPGHLDPANSAAVVRMLETGAQACLERAADALVTAPVQKSVINQAGIGFQGHTEFLAALTGAPHPVMLLRSARLSVALATTHLPLADVPRAITKSSLIATLRVVDEDLRRRFGLARPRIMVLGLNPHAGENGVLGTEENDIIAPAVAELADSGLAVFGPVSADSAFTPQSLEDCDVVVAMYHDQGLPVLKAQDFGEIVNVTLGLPIIRTSVDHGTALSLAGTGRASHASLRAATELAIRLAAGDGA